jgi:hypothetical protein
MSFEHVAVPLPSQAPILFINDVNNVAITGDDKVHSLQMKRNA